ncbi:MAG: hypothetical protein CSA33_06600 [Desulfobulbus propionicus]|nr:MAG: hypothetical protein CSA33_06600 [Desulfobulbus propionicus]
MEQPIQKQKLVLSPIWILPLLALCLGGWLLYTGVREAGIDITVHFQDANGITPGKTKVIFKGIPIGTVQDVTVDQNMSGVNILIEMKNSARSLLVEDTAFWLVKPEVSAGRISGLDTLLSGTYIGAQKGKSDQSASFFKGLPEKPPLDPAIPGLRFTLIADDLYSLQRESKIYTKNLQIGHIEHYFLREDGKIAFNAYIKPQFSHLIKNETRFWNSSGLSLTGNLQQGVSVDIESIASLVYGGISCHTPEDMEQQTTPAESGAIFALHKDFEDAEFGLDMHLQLASGEGIVTGKTKVMYRGLKVGVVKEVILNNDDLHTVTARILLDPRAKAVLRQNTKFWVIKPEVGLTGINNLETLLGGMYITFSIGTGGYRDSFIVEPGPMPKPASRGGKYFKLTSADSGSLAIGAPVLYKKLQVGEITNITLNPDGSKVLVIFLVYNEYAQLVRNNSVFWNVSGIHIDGSITDIKVHLNSLQTVLAGGISFLTPAQEKKKQAAEGTVFPLYRDLAEALSTEEMLRDQGMVVQVITDKMPTLSIGSPLLYNKVTIGTVVGFRLAEDNKRVLIELVVQAPYTDLLSTASRFYSTSGVTLEGSLKGVKLETESLASILSGGLALLNKESGEKVQPGHRFRLCTSRREAEHASDLHLRLYVPHAKGIQPGTRITYKGVAIGEVESVHLNQEATGVVARAFVTARREHLFRSQSRLLLVQPTFSLTNPIRFNTLLTGPYIEVIKGEGLPCTEYNVLKSPPTETEEKDGLALILETPHLGSIDTGTPIFFRQVQVGMVTGYQLSPGSQQVWIRVHIDPKFTHLIYSGSRFWNSSGIRVSGGVFSGLSVNTESMQALLRGGISFATPEGKEMGSAAQSGDHFLLATSAQEEWLTWQPLLPAPEDSGRGQRRPAGRD